MSAADAEQAVVWTGHASQWNLVEAPLRPSPEDGDLILRGLVPVFLKFPDQCRLAVLGVTSELVNLGWPTSVELTSFDHSAHMIAKVWRPNPNVKSTVKEADWRKLPVLPGTFHGVVGDGSLNVFPHLTDYQVIAKEMHRVTSPDGFAVLRCFVRPSTSETAGDVKAAVEAGCIGSFHAFKWRLAMTLTDPESASVVLADIWRAFQASFPSREELSEIAGWPEAQISTIDVYKDAPTRYTFPTFDQIVREVGPFFEVVERGQAGYELAERCPTLVLKRRAARDDFA